MITYSFFTPNLEYYSPGLLRYLNTEFAMHPNSLQKMSIVVLLFTSLLCSYALAEPNQIAAITEDRVNLSAAGFLPEFISKSPERRTAARLYLLGVLDSTEGKSWCSYSQINTVTINEFVFEYLKKQPAEKLKLRASVLIEEALHHSFPCQSAQ